jgi:Ca-activated chloride channel family protein
VFNPQTFENSRPDGFPVLEIVDGDVGGGSGPDRPRLFVPLRRTELTGEVVGPVAALRVSQRYRFTAAQSPRPIEAVYRFPLPGDAAVTGVRVRFGEVEIRAELAERAAAEHEYQIAREEGRQAALLTREAPDVFTLQVAGPQPDQDVTIETSYDQLARPEGEGWTLRVPLTTVPRFVRADERGSAFADGQPLAVLRDPGHRFALDLTVEGADRAASPTHALDVAETEGRLRVRLRDGEVLPDRDCVLSWQPPRVARRPTLQVLWHAEQAGDAACFLALVAPPAVAPADALAREVILLIDHSGSMSGPKWEAADWAVQNLLAGLTPADTFNLCLFHSKTRWLARQPIRGDERAVKQARDFLLRHKDSGGTELGVALEQALDQPRVAGAGARHVVIVTDAQVSDAGRILALVEREASRPDRRRVDVLCIDAAPNSGLANELAERGGGLARFLTSNPAENDIASALDEVLAEWAAPVLRDLTLEVDRATVQAAGRRVSPAGDGRSAIDLGDLPAGRAVWVAGRLAGSGAGGVQTGPGAAPTLRLLAEGREVAAEQPSANAIAGSRPAVAALFGARRVLDLELARTSGVDLAERLRQLGYDPREVLEQPTVPGDAPIYPENARKRSTDALHALLVRESLRYGIVCSATAFVATRHEAGEPVAGTVAVANALAHGWSPDFLTPRMALTSAASALMASPMTAPPGALHRLAESARERSFATPDAPFELAREMVRRLRRGGGTHGTADGDSGAADTAGSTDGLAVLFAGTPRFVGSEAVLYDSSAEPARLPARDRLARLVVRLAGGPPSGPIDPGLAILLYVDDPTTPRARVRLADLIRQGGERPLNVRRRQGQLVRVVLLDPNGAWAGGAPPLEVAIS